MQTDNPGGQHNKERGAHGETHAHKTAPPHLQGPLVHHGPLIDGVWRQVPQHPAPLLLHAPVPGVGLHPPEHRPDAPYHSQGLAVVGVQGEGEQGLARSLLQVHGCVDNVCVCVGGGGNGSKAAIACITSHTSHV